MIDISSYETISSYNAVTLIITLAVLINYINHRYFKVQSSIVIMTSSLLISIIAYILGYFGFNFIQDSITKFIELFRFQSFMINGVLGLLLFAGSLTVDISRLKKQKIEIGMLSSVSVIISTILIGLSIYYLLYFFGFNLSLISCFLFGALISPTDPVAALAVFKEINAPKDIENLITAESLFNDGVGIVIFISIYEACFSGIPIDLYVSTWLFLKKVIGGVVFGLLLGYITYLSIKDGYNYKSEILGTIALIMGGYSLAGILGISGPLAMVTAGIFIANNKEKICHTRSNQKYLEDFWNIIEEFLNAVLFLLMGFVFLIIKFSYSHIIVSLVIIVCLLVSRFISIVVPINFIRLKVKYPIEVIKILTWGGLRGGLAIALSLTIPYGNESIIIVPITYIVVVFSVLVQGTTIKRVIIKSLKLTSRN